MNKVTVIGMDLGDKNHKAVALSVDGAVMDRTEVLCTPEAVRTYLKRHPGALLAVETGTHCRWISRLGQELGHEVLVGNARKLRMIWDSSRKNDWRDAEMLAKVARTDRSLLSPVRLRCDGDHELMRLVKSRDLLVKNRTGIVNQIRGFCKSEGVRQPKCSAASFKRLEHDLPANVQPVVKPLFAVLEELGKKIGLYNTMIVEAVQRLHGDDVALLEPIGGVGPVTAANFIMGPFGKDCDLRRHGIKIAERGGKNAKKRAKVAVARKLAVLMLAILKTRSAYRPLADVEVVA
jgi:transposase